MDRISYRIQTLIMVYDLKGNLIRTTTKTIRIFSVKSTPPHLCLSLFIMFSVSLCIWSSGLDLANSVVFLRFLFQ